jgi:hypothetical protein
MTKSNEALITMPVWFGVADKSTQHARHQPCLSNKSRYLHLVDVCPKNMISLILSFKFML